MPQVQRFWSRMQPQIDRAARQLGGDPLGTRETIETELRTPLEELNEGLTLLIEQVTRHEDFSEKLQEAKQIATRHRSVGLKLVEDEGNPDIPMQEAGHLLKSARFTLEKGNGTEAKVLLDDALTHIEDARDRMQRHEEARELLETEIPRARHELDRLRGLIPRNRDTFERLKRTHHPDTWQEVQEMFDDGKKALDEIESALGEAENCNRPERQYYMQAMDLLQYVENQQQSAETLIGSPEHTFTRLETLRKECESRFRALAVRCGQLKTYHDNHQPAVHSYHLDALRRITDVMRNVETDLRQSASNWAAIHHELVELDVILDDLQGDMEEEAQQHRELTEALQEVGHYARQVDQFLRQHTADRRDANQAYSRALNELQRLQKQVTRSEQDWPSLLSQTQQLRESFATSEHLAREDISQAKQASDLILATARGLQKSKMQYRMGVSAQTSQADSLLDRARSLLEQQRYEQATEAAQQAELSIRHAQEEAVQEIRRRQEAARQQQIQAAQEMIFDVVGGMLGGRVKSRRSRPPRNFRRERDPFRFDV